MRFEEIASDVRSLAFDFFYWFSRFEFALKENGFLKNETQGSRAEPGWDKFVKAHEATYSLSAAGSQLITEAPKRQIVGQDGLEFVPVDFGDQPSELDKVVRLLKTVRNNLFHGGKHDVEGWDDPERTMLLMELCIRILDELADLGGIEADYKCKY